MPAHRMAVDPRAVVLVCLIGAAGCTGGGTTGHERLDVRTGPPPSTDSAADLAIVDASSAVDVSALPDGSAPGDVSLRSDVSEPDDVVDPIDDGGSASDGRRIREGAVVRDGLIIDPAIDAASERDSAPDTGPPTVCGDGKKEGTEECDDGNKLSGDGCSSFCTDTRTCDACIASKCADVFETPVWPLCAYMVGNAANGEGAGRPRKDLCQEVYSCALRTQCMVWRTADVTPCYCGSAKELDCFLPGHPDGPCRVEIENGVESTDPKVVIDNLVSAANPSGAALLVRQCARDMCGPDERSEVFVTPSRLDECSPDAIRDAGPRDAPDAQ